jgi:hypothetical protein
MVSYSALVIYDLPIVKVWPIRNELLKADNSNERVDGWVLRRLEGKYTIIISRAVSQPVFSFKYYIHGLDLLLVSVFCKGNVIFFSYVAM